MNKRWKKAILRLLLLFTSIILLLLATGYVLTWRYKGELLAEVNKAVSNRIYGKLEIKDVDFTIFRHFPAFSLTLEDAVLRDSLYPLHHVELFHADKIVLQLEVLKLLRGELNLKSITVTNAMVSLVKMKNGYNNSNIIKKRDSVANGVTSQFLLTTTVDKIIFKNVQCDMVDSTNNKWFSIHIHQMEQSIAMIAGHVRSNLEGTLFFGGLCFNREMGSYLTNKTLQARMVLDFDESQHQLRMQNAKVAVDGRKFLLRGNLVFGNSPKMHLEIDAANVSVREAMTILPQRIASRLESFDFEMPLLVGVRIDGKLISGSKPAVDVFFKTETNAITLYEQHFSDVNTLGWFTNHIYATQINDDRNSRLMLTRFNASLGGIPIVSKATISNLVDPYLQLKAAIDMPLEELNGIIDTSQFIFNDGAVHLKLNYGGRIKGYIDKVNNHVNVNMTGNLQVTDGEFTYLPRGFEFSGVNGALSLDDSLMNIESLQMKINQNAIRISGQVVHFVPFLFIPNESLFANLNVNAGTINFDLFGTAKHSNASRKKTSKKKTLNRKLNQSIENFINTTEADLLLSADKVISDRFVATGTKGHIILKSDYVKFRDVRMNTSGGTFSLSGSVSSLQKAPFNMSIVATVDHADISNLFYAFKNFNQNAITSENVEGSISCQINFNSRLNNAYKVDPASMNGKIIFTVENGTLINLEGFEKLSQFVFKNRDFSRIAFANLHDTMWLKGQQLTFARFPILSNVATLFAEGVYGFNGGTDISIQVPLSNLKKQDRAYKSEQIAEDKKVGPSIFLRAQTGTDGKIQFTYDPFKNYFKDHASDSTIANASDSESISKDNKIGKKSKPKKNQ